MMETSAMNTPCYCFDLDRFERRVDEVADALPGIPLCYSIKANPFLLERLPRQIRRVEVCSPGELDICKALGIPGERIIYSGVLKRAEDIYDAIAYEAGLLTCESIRQAEQISEAACGAGMTSRVLLRLTSGNQFGMSLADIKEILRRCGKEELHLQAIGIHYYSGTQKNLRRITRDLEKLEAALDELRSEMDFVPGLVEYGPGLLTEYFAEDCDAAESQALLEAAPSLCAFAQKFPLGIEMGRFLAASAGTYHTSVCDLKTSCDTHYAILDGGIHHLNYYGQRMAMQVPPLVTSSESSVKREYCLCGSLCTTADVLVREVPLPELHIGDQLEFGRCGAYSVTEAPALFLSRPMPEIYVRSEAGGLRLIRRGIHTSVLNRRDGSEDPWN